ncbi:MAG: PspC domain-containing protein [Bacillota bacterium]
MEPKRLYRSNTQVMLSGVCGGIAEYFEIDVTLVRLIWALITIFSAFFPGLIAYIVCAIIIPQAPKK